MVWSTAGYAFKLTALSSWPAVVTILMSFEMMHAPSFDLLTNFLAHELSIFVSMAL